MIDPNNIIKYDRTEFELQELILFLVCVAGKTASTVSRQLNEFLEPMEGTKLSKPFDLIKFYDSYWMLREKLEARGFGQYTKLERAFRELANSKLDLKKCSLEDLMKIHGIGRKSASCFLAWTRKDCQVAMLDTHLLKFLRDVKIELGKDPKYDVENYAEGELEKLPKSLLLLIQLNGVLKFTKIPKSTPSSKTQYDSLERIYLHLSRMMGKDPTEFDLEIWRFYSQKLDKKK